MPPRLIAIVGPNEADDEACRLAYDAGAQVAGRGDVVVTGGLGGVMAAASRGARDAGGQVLALLPGDKAAAANEAVGIAVATGLGELRNGLLVRAADAVIAIGGSWGTLSEIALARRTGVPVVAVCGWNVTDRTGAPVSLDTAPNAAEAVQAVYRALENDTNRLPDD
jgi:uncharacterized protein (TIGR00725 family)